MKKIMLMLLALCLLLMGCSSEDKIPTEDVELWVVTELTDKYGMNEQAERMIEQFQEMYPNVTVKLDILPVAAEERAVYLQKIRTKIMGGAGPDVYLMPTHNSVPDLASVRGGYMQVEPLYRDVNTAMYNCLFYDISKYYDADEALKTEELNTSVMDAGVMDGCRYVLPLRYNCYVYLVDRENLEAQGLDVSIFEKSANELIAAAQDMENIILARRALPSNPEPYFSGLTDQVSGEVLLTAEEVEELMRLYQAALAAETTGDGGNSTSAMNYIYDGRFFASDGSAVVKAVLSSAMEAMAVAKVQGEELEMYPYLATDGTLKATIECYAAVGSGSEYPRLAYEFARMFLLEEAQFETYFTSGEYRKAIIDTSLPGWPVRTTGSVGARFRLLQFNLRNRQDNHNKNRVRQFLQEDFTLTDAEVPAVSWQVSEARFPVIMEQEDGLYYYLSQLNNYQNNYAPTDADIDALAQEYIDKMQLYLDEG